METLGGSFVAKRKPAPEESPQDEPESSGGEATVDRTKWGKQRIILQLRGSQAFRDVLEKLVEYDGQKSMSDLVDRALRHYAREIKFPETFPKR